MTRYGHYGNDEIKWLMDNYATSDWEEITSHLNRSMESIKTKASQLGLKRENTSCARYTQQEDNLIRALYETSKESELQYNTEELIAKELPHRTLKSIQYRANSLGLRVRKQWTNEEDDYLRENHLSMTVNELATHFHNHSKTSVYNRIIKLGLTGGPMFAYTGEDIAYITDNYKWMTDSEIGNHLNRAAGSIKEFRRKLGLQRPRPEGVIYGLNEFVHRNNTEWKKASAANCGYKCIITGNDFDDIHHLYARNLIIKDMLSEHPEIDPAININDLDDVQKEHILRLFHEKQAQYPLGVCLTHEVHMDFHRKYGLGNNTPDQFVEYVRSFAPEKLDMLKIA